MPVFPVYLPSRCRFFYFLHLSQKTRFLTLNISFQHIAHFQTRTPVLYRLLYSLVNSRTRSVLLYAFRQQLLLQYFLFGYLPLESFHTNLLPHTQTLSITFSIPIPFSAFLDDLIILRALSIAASIPIPLPL